MNTESKSGFFSWKTIFFILAVIVFIFFRFENKGKPSLKDDSIAKISISTQITRGDNLVTKLEELRKNKKLHALIIEMDSPGGEVVPSFEIYESIRKFSEEKKPVVIVMKSVAASGGYLISVGGDYIIAHPTTITGSIGVVFIQPDLKDLMNKIGVKPLIFRTGKLKFSPNPSETTSEETKQMMMRVAEGTKKQFLDLVVSRRQIKDEKIIEDIANSGIYLGVDAKEIGLVDELGGIDQAIAWLKTQNINFPVENVNIREEEKSSLLKKLLSGNSMTPSEQLGKSMEKITEKISRSGMYLLYE